MNRFTRVNDEEKTCGACGLIICKAQRLIMHHISYFPEITMPVHNSCHAKIHAVNHPELKHLLPTKSDTQKFYGYNETNLPPTTFLLDKESHEILMKSAKNNDRSVSAELRVILKELKV